MNDTVNVRVFSEHLVKCSFICDIEVVEPRPLAAYEFNAIKDLLRRIVQIICNNNLVVGLQKGEGGKRPNISSTAAS